MAGVDGSPATPSGSAYRIDTSVVIAASRARVWQVLTEPALLERWLSDQPVNITTTWQVGAPIITSGDFHGKTYTNKGVILAHEPPDALSYTYWSSLSEQADIPENYSAIEFSLAPEAGGIHLRVTHTNLTTPEIFGHWRFYWRMALQRLNRLAEEA